MIIKKHVIIIFLIILSKVLIAQDPMFTQFYANQVYLNPALSGSAISPRFSLSYRSSMPVLSSPFTTYSVSYDQYVKPLHGGIGVNIINDVQGNGIYNALSFNAAYSYFIKVSRKFRITAAIQTSYNQTKFNSDEMVFMNMNEPVGIEPVNCLDFSTGITGSGKNYYFGIAVHHLAQVGKSLNNGSIDKLPLKYTAHFGTTIAVDNRGLREKNFFVSPNIIYQQQQNMQQINYGLYIIKKSLTFGVWFSQNLTYQYDAIIGLIGFSYSNFKFSYSYDFAISKFRNVAVGAHEISLGIDIGGKNSHKKNKRGAISCPAF